MTDVQVASDADIPDVQRLFREYAAWVGVHLSFRFREVAPYRPNPVPGARFLELVLE